MPRVVHFEIHADDTERAVNFYKTVFGWEFQSWGGPQEYFLITTGPADEPGINGGLMKRMGNQTGDIIMAYVCSVDVPSVDDYVDKALANGGQMALPKMAVTGVGWLAYVKDTEGNILGIYQNDPSAK